MHHQLWFTALLNKFFSGAVTALLQAVGVHVEHPATPIDNIFAMEVLVFLVLITLFVLVRVKLSVEKPGDLQHFVESVEGYIKEQAEQIIGHGYEGYIPYVMTMGFFILFANLLGLIPGFESPTAAPVVPLGLATLTFLYYHYHGIRHQGAHYIKQFLGPVWYLAPLMFLIEVVSHFARILSLTVRLYANMFAGDLVTLAFFSLVPFLVPVLFLALHFGVAIIQTFIFMVLTMVYLGMALSEEH